MTSWNLTKLKSYYKIILALIVAGLTLIIFLAVWPIIKPKSPPERVDYLPLQTQPVKEGKFDNQAPISKQSKGSIDKLKSKLPYRKIVETSTGQKIIFVIIASRIDLYTLTIEVVGIDFQSTYDDPNLAKNVLTFRETAQTIFDWMEDQGVKSNEVFITWGSRAFQQQSAEAWLNESPQYPKVIKRENQFVFEVEPDKSQTPSPQPGEETTP